MDRFRISKGLDIPLAGAPVQTIDDAAAVSSVALLGPDTIGIRPRLQVDVGDRVRLGQVLYTDRHNPDVNFTAPGCGVVEAINRGARRSLQSVVIRLEGDDSEAFDTVPSPASLTRDKVRDILVRSGQWTAFRSRPFSKVPAPDATPAAIFVTAIDTNPHAPDPEVVVSPRAADFELGLQAIATLTDGPVHVCTRPDTDISVPAGDSVRHSSFSGPHPAGLAGTHIHLLEPVGERKMVWHIGYQDVIAIGCLLRTGQLDVERVISLSGPLVRSPRLLRTRIGAHIPELVAGEAESGKKRVVSGSVLAGRRAATPVCWMGRYHLQVSVLPEGSEREFLAWARPGTRKYSAIRAYAAHLLHRGDFDLTSSQNGSPRAMVSIGTFEKVMPLDILATPLLKALLVTDTDAARELGCLELDEEDLALCSFVCNGKYEYGPFLRESLTEIEVNG